MGKNSHECLLSTTSCNVFSKNTRVRIVKLCQHLDSFRARCQTLTWPPGCHTGVPEHVFLLSWPFLITWRAAVWSSWVFFIPQWYERFRKADMSRWQMCPVPCLSPGASGHARPCSHVPPVVALW